MMYDDVDLGMMYDVVLRLEVCIITVKMILRSRWRRAQDGDVLRLEVSMITDV